ncbi:MAG: site-specific integrase [Bacteroidales bacterium]|nr:site-specific integrase [Bacteroidales bacterium]
MSSTTVLIVFRHHERPDKTKSLNLRIIHNRKIAYIPLNTFVTEDEWLKLEQQIDKKCKRYENLNRINDYLTRKKLEAKSLISDLYETGEADYISVKEIRDRFLNKTDISTLERFTKKLIAEFKKANRLGNATVYEMTLSFVKKHNNDQDISFKNINYSFLKKLEAEHLAGGNSLNSLSVYLRTLRAIYNRAINQNVAKRDWYPFKQYSIRSTKTQKRAISKEDVKKIEEYKSKPGSQYFHARNYFMFSFYMIGMNFSDMAYLTPSNVVNGRLEYKRKKTGKFYSLALFDKAHDILNYYLKGKKKDEYIFPIIERTDPEHIRMDIQNKLRTFNKYIGQIASELKIQGNITSYVARHSWASIGKFLNVPIQVISEGLGHDNIQTTQIYLDSFETNVIDDATKLITS